MTRTLSAQLRVSLAAVGLSVAFVAGLAHLQPAKSVLLCLSFLVTAWFMRTGEDLTSAYDRLRRLFSPLTLVLLGLIINLVPVVALYGFGWGLASLWVWLGS